MGYAVFQLPFGRSRAGLRIPSHQLLKEVAPPESEQEVDESAVLRDALARPIGTPRLRDLASTHQKVAVVTSDLTRPCPSDKLVPPVLDELTAAGVPAANVTVVMALGLHRPMADVEIDRAVGAGLRERVRVVNHDPEDTVQLGITSAGTPVALFRPVVEADLRVCLGNLELHYFAGYSGGAKAIFPGCASVVGVRANHAMMVRAEATAGQLEENPVRADLEEAAAMVGVDFICNVVVDSHHRIVAAVTGDVTEAHRYGCGIVTRRARTSIPGPADVVVVSAGGYPKDVNLYQAQKALDSAARAAKRGGVIILVAECREGFGNQTFEEWMLGATSPDEILTRLREGFVLGGHKAAAIARILKRANVYLVSTMSAEDVRRSGLVPFEDLDAAVAAACDRQGKDMQVIVMPEGGSVLPAFAG